MSKVVPELPGVPVPTAPYSPAVVSGGFVFISGQGGTEPDGRVPSDAASQTRVAMRRITAILAALDLGPEAIVKTTVFVTDMADFADVNAAYGEFFTGGHPARSTVEVSALPRPELVVEIEAVASV